MAETSRHRRNMSSAKPQHLSLSNFRHYKWRRARHVARGVAKVRVMLAASAASSSAIYSQCGSIVASMTMRGISESPVLQLIHRAPLGRADAASDPLNVDGEGGMGIKKRIGAARCRRRLELTGVYAVPWREDGAALRATYQASSLLLDPSDQRSGISGWRGRARVIKRRRRTVGEAELARSRGRAARAGCLAISAAAASKAASRTRHRLKISAEVQQYRRSAYGRGHVRARVGNITR